MDKRVREISRLFVAPPRVFPLSVWRVSRTLLSSHTYAFIHHSMFSESFPCFLVHHGSCRTAHWPGELSENISFYKTFETSCRPRLNCMTCCIATWGLRCQLNGFQRVVKYLGLLPGTSESSNPPWTRQAAACEKVLK